MEDVESIDMLSSRRGLSLLEGGAGGDLILTGVVGVAGCSSSSGSSSSISVLRCGSTLAPIVGAKLIPNPGALAGGGALNISSNEFLVDAEAEIVPDKGLGFVGGRGDEGAATLKPKGLGDRVSCMRISSSLSRSGICTSEASSFSRSIIKLFLLRRLPWEPSPPVLNLRPSRPKRPSPPGKGQVKLFPELEAEVSPFLAPSNVLSALSRSDRISPGALMGLAPSRVVSGLNDRATRLVAFGGGSVNDSIDNIAGDLGAETTPMFGRNA